MEREGTGWNVMYISVCVLLGACSYMPCLADTSDCDCTDFCKLHNVERERKGV